MVSYACSFLYRYQEENIAKLLTNALGVLGFEPKYMTIFFDEFEPSLDNIVSDEVYFFELFKRQPETMTVKSQLYDEDNRETNNWFRFRLHLNRPYDSDSCSFEWCNIDLKFLMENEIFNTFLNSQSLIYCYCYNQYDCIDQSNDRVSSFLENYPNRKYKIVKKYMNDNVIDVSEHWGRYISTLEMTFMAAPLMWFGEEYFKIIPKESLLKFKGSSNINYTSFNLVYIKLFELYDNPAKLENRQRQKDFWERFDLHKKAEQYEKDRPFDLLLGIEKEQYQERKKRKDNNEEPPLLAQE